MDFYHPHHTLGLHQLASGEKVIRLFRPLAARVYVEVFGRVVEAFGVGGGFYEYQVPANTTAKDYRVWHDNGLLAHDPYAFWPTFGPLDEHLFSSGVHYKLYEVMGARLAEVDGVKGVKFAVWAPSAKQVNLIADFNHWDIRVNPMRVMGASGVFELFVPGIGVGHYYKFAITPQTGNLRIKADPFALAAEVRPGTASSVADVDSFIWSDEEWQTRPKNLDRPMNVYEVHLGSWKQDQGRFKNYRELAHELAAYCQEMHFTHIELMPIMEHPFDQSWGYQVTGFFAATSRFGTPQDFQYFVNYLHLHEIGVILDWVPAHFPSDDHALRYFDGTYLYEHVDSRQGYHPHWNTCIFNYGRREVSNFLLASALFWLDKMHIDGLRVDAVASMLYLDYGRDQGAWIPNVFGGKENLEAIEFIKHMNSVVHHCFPQAIMIAEESTSFPGVTTPVEWGGLGFDLKWSMGWMNDTLYYFKKDPIYRSHHHEKLTFGLLYAFSERFQLVLSHDEVVHGKRSLLEKMPGDYWQRFANLRLLFSYMFCQPGKKLLFMGGEFGQSQEWDSGKELDWFLRLSPPHEGVRNMVKELGRLYKAYKAFWGKDFAYEGFEWIDLHNAAFSIITYKRKAEGQELICIHNFTPHYFGHYYIPEKHPVREIFCSDKENFGGSNKVNLKISKEGHGFSIQLAPLATHIFLVCPTKTISS